MQHVAWHLIGLFAAWVQEGRIRIEVRDGAMWVIPVKQ
jgi:hypothetical protein